MHSNLTVAFCTAVALHFHALVKRELSWENPQYISNKHFKPSKTILTTSLAYVFQIKKDVTLQILKFLFKPHTYINTSLNEASLLKWNGISRLLRPNSSKKCSDSYILKISFFVDLAWYARINRKTCIFGF